MKQHRNNQLLTISITDEVAKILNLKTNKSGFIRNLVLKDFYENRERYEKEFFIKNQMNQHQFGEQ